MSSPTGSPSPYGPKPRRSRAESPSDLALLPDIARAVIARHTPRTESGGRPGTAAEGAGAGAGAGPAEWSVEQGEFWCHVVPGEAVGRAQGWKLHVPATPLSAPLVLARCAEVLVAHRAAFKFAGSPARVAALVSGRFARGGGGKFLTVYPADDDRFRLLAEELHGATRGCPAPPSSPTAATGPTARSSTGTACSGESVNSPPTEPSPPGSPTPKAARRRRAQRLVHPAGLGRRPVPGPD